MFASNGTYLKRPSTNSTTALISVFFIHIFCRYLFWNRRKQSLFTFSVTPLLPSLHMMVAPSLIIWFYDSVIHHIFIHCLRVLVLPTMANSLPQTLIWNAKGYISFSLFFKDTTGVFNHCNLLSSSQRLPTWGPGFIVWRSKMTSGARGNGSHGSLCGLTSVHMPAEIWNCLVNSKSSGDILLLKRTEDHT